MYATVTSKSGLGGIHITTYIHVHKVLYYIYTLFTNWSLKSSVSNINTQCNSCPGQRTTILSFDVVSTYKFVCFNIVSS